MKHAWLASTLRVAVPTGGTHSCARARPVPPTLTVGEVFCFSHRPAFSGSLISNMCVCKEDTGCRRRRPICGFATRISSRGVGVARSVKENGGFTLRKQCRAWYRRRFISPWIFGHERDVPIFWSATNKARYCLHVKGFKRSGRNSPSSSVGHSLTAFPPVDPPRWRCLIFRPAIARRIIKQSLDAFVSRKC